MKVSRICAATVVAAAALALIGGCSFDNSSGIDSAPSAVTGATGLSGGSDVSMQQCSNATAIAGSFLQTYAGQTNGDLFESRQTGKADEVKKAASTFGSSTSSSKDSIGDDKLIESVSSMSQAAAAIATDYDKHDVDGLLAAEQKLTEGGDAVVEMCSGPAASDSSYTSFAQSLTAIKDASGAGAPKCPIGIDYSISGIKANAGDPAARDEAQADVLNLRYAAAHLPAGDLKTRADALHEVAARVVAAPTPSEADAAPLEKALADAEATCR